MICHIDFETRSPVNLLTDGAYKYAEKAEVLCMAYAYDDGPIHIWKPLEKEPFPDDLALFIEQGGECWAHNAEFEHVIFQATMPLHAPEAHQWVCTATMARACALPGKLELLARCLGTRAQKDARGLELIKELCIPRKVVAGVPLYNEDQDLLQELYDYCIQDVETERACGDCLRHFTDDEHDDFLVNLIINEAGIPVDLELAEHASKYASEERNDLLERIRFASHGDLSKATGTGLTNWVYGHLPDDLQPLMHKYKDGDRKISLDRRVRAELLAEQDLDPDVREVVECSDQANKSSIAKFQGMKNRAQQDDRVRGAYLLNGAGQTGRFSSTGLQLHNFPRAGVNDPEDVLDWMFDGDSLVHDDLDTMTVLSRMLRPAIYAPEGKVLVWADWSAIEGRVLPWLTNNVLANKKLDLFAAGEDVYVHTAASMFGLELDAVDDDYRQQGKIAELSLGFAGGAGALKSMARNYGVHFDDAQAERIKHSWRKANQWAPPYWKALEGAAMRAIRKPETMQQCGKVHYFYTPDVLQNALWCQLPSGRLICYPGARIEQVTGKFGPQTVITAVKGNLQPKKGENEWPRVTLWSGLLCENITQGTAADLLRGSLRQLVLDQDAPVIGHTHDEIILEVDDNTADVQDAYALLRTVMTAAPAWAEGLPLAISTGSGLRYGK